MSHQPPPPPPPPSGPQFYPQSPYPVPPKKQSKVLWIVLGIVGGVIVVCGIGSVVGVLASGDPEVSSTEKSAVDLPEAQSEVSEDLEPADTDADGVVDAEDLDPNDPQVQTEDDVDTDKDRVPDYQDYDPDDRKVQTRDDVDTDKDGVPDYKDDFPKNAAYSKDTDGDNVADQVDDFPKDDRYSKDTDGDGVADSKDDFPADPSRSRITSAMYNAIDAAQSYLDYSAFSRTGLIGQLEYEGYKTADATFAVDYLKVDWNKQAAKSAESYLDYSSFSRDGLIQQLQYEGFTYEQAVYGVNKVY